MAGCEATILATILTSHAVVVLRISVVVTGSPLLAGELDFTEAGLPWLRSLYTLIFGGS